MMLASLQSGPVHMHSVYPANVYLSLLYQLIFVRVELIWMAVCVGDPPRFTVFGVDCSIC
jgi:hypothetical protein